MERLEGLSTFTQTLKDHLPEYLTSRIARRLLTVESMHLRDLPHLIFQDHCYMLAETYLHAFIHRFYAPQILSRTTSATYETSVNNSKYTVEYSASSHHFELDVNTTTMNETSCIIDVLKHLCSHSPMNQQRTIIVLHHGEMIPVALANSMKSILQMYSNTHLFIMLCEKFGHALNALQSQCTVVRLCPNLSWFCDTLFPECMTINKNYLISKAQHNVLNLYLLSTHNLNDNGKGVYIGHLQQYIGSRLSELVSKYQTYTHHQLLRETVLDIVSCCIPLRDVCHEIICLTYAVAPNCTMKIVELCVDMEHMTHLSNKTIFPIEKYLEEIVRELSSQKNQQ
jgi:hypothetical protein